MDVLYPRYAGLDVRMDTAVACVRMPVSHGAANSEVRTFQCLRHRHGLKNAICAVAASILTAAYHMLRVGTLYQDLGPSHFNSASPEDQANRLARQIAKLGFTCSLDPLPRGPVCV